MPDAPTPTPRARPKKKRPPRPPAPEVPDEVPVDCSVPEGEYEVGVEPADVSSDVEGVEDPSRRNRLRLVAPQGADTDQPFVAPQGTDTDQSPVAPQGTDGDQPQPDVPDTVDDPLPLVQPPAAVVRAEPVTLGQALATDGVRRALVTISYLFCLTCALLALAGANSSATLSLLAPAAQAGRIWWVVLLGLGVYVGWLWLPGTAAEPRSRAIAYPSAVSMGLLGVWLLLLRGGALVVGAVAAVVVVVALMVTLRRAGTVPSRGFVGRQCGQLGLAVTLGWMAVTASSAVAEALVSSHVRAYFVSAETWGILATTALFAAGMALLRYFPGRLYIAAALAWGFFWIAYGRVLGQPRSYLLAAVALVCALLILIAGIAVFLWARGRVRERVD